MVTFQDGMYLYNPQYNCSALLASGKKACLTLNLIKPRVYISHNFYTLSHLDGEKSQSSPHIIASILNVVINRRFNRDRCVISLGRDTVFSLFQRSEMQKVVLCFRMILRNIRVRKYNAEP